MTSSNKLAVFSICFALLAVSCTDGTAASEKSANNDKAPVTTPAKAEPTPQTQEVSKGAQDTTPCTEVFLTGTGGGPAAQFGNAQALSLIHISEPTRPY